MPVAGLSCEPHCVIRQYADNILCVGCGWLTSWKQICIAKCHQCTDENENRENVCRFQVDLINQYTDDLNFALRLAAPA